MDQNAYERMFGGTPMTRAKRSGLRRNAIIAAAVRKDPETFAILDQLLNDTDPVVRATAITAKSY
jgi:epoxyqueuosine reductase